MVSPFVVLTKTGHNNKYSLPLLFACLCKHRLLAKTNSLLIRSIRRTLTAEHEVVGSNPDWTTTKPGLQKLLYGCIFLLCSCITLACFSIYFMGSRSTSTFWLSFHFPTWLQWNLSFGTSLFKRQFHSEDTKFHPRKLFTLSFYLLPLLKGHLYSGERDTFSGPETRV